MTFYKATPNGPVSLSEQEIEEAQARELAWEEESTDRFIKEIADLIESLVDDTARSKQYENGVSLASYANSTVEQWKLEAATFIAWRDSVWAYAYEQLAIYSGNEEPLPSVDQFMESLPKIQWPD
jgi:hypothetical protein